MSRSSRRRLAWWNRKRPISLNAPENFFSSNSVTDRASLRNGVHDDGAAIHLSVEPKVHAQGFRRTRRRWLRECRESRSANLPALPRQAPASIAEQDGRLFDARALVQGACHGFRCHHQRGPPLFDILWASATQKRPEMLARSMSKAGIPGTFSRFWTSAETPGNCRWGVSPCRR